LASLIGHRRGADVTACDVHPLTGAFLLANARLNGLERLRYRHGPWQSDRQVGVAYDLVIGSDLLYAPDSRGDLANFVDRHAAAAAEVWIVDPNRGNRPAFHRRMTERGFVLRESNLSRPATASRAAYQGRVLTYRRSS
jgi:predicted nicotinamide N-methyase